MRIGLIDVDGHKGHPNLALMRLSAYHKNQGHTVDWWNGFEHYDRVYMSKVFTFTPDFDTVIPTVMITPYLLCDMPMSRSLIAGGIEHDQED